LEFYVESGDVAAYAAGEHVSVEAAARELRYGFFRRLLGSGEDEAPRGLKPGRNARLMIAALKALRHPKAQVSS
jgi:hypothetical protein